LAEAFLLELDGREGVGVAGLFAKLGGAPGEERWAVGLGKEEEGDEGGAGEDQADPEDPSPAKNGRDES